MATRYPKSWTSYQPENQAKLGQQLIAGATRGFTPYVPPPIPSGSYDPSLDASRNAAARGLFDTTQDTTLAGARAGEDYGFGQADINTGYDRGIQDIGTQRTQTNEDYNRNTSLLTRSFGILGNQQAEQARKYGVTSGGIALLSAAKRAANQGIQQDALNTSHDRTLAGLDTAQTRLGEDKTTSLGRLDVGYNRGVTDRSTALSRAGREDAFFGLDTEGQKAFQAGQAGYSAPQRGEAGGMPANQFTRADGSQYQIIRRGGKRYIRDSNGNERPA